MNFSAFITLKPELKEFMAVEPDHALGVKLAQIALSFGADDMDGTVKEEIITHMAGAETEQAMSIDALVRIIKEAGRVPVQRGTLYDVIKRY